MAVEVAYALIRGEVNGTPPNFEVKLTVPAVPPSTAIGMGRQLVDDHQVNSDDANENADFGSTR
jgi:hypothetical protein